MALSTPPYTVVHTNAAFGHLTGLHSNNILGETLHNLLKNEGASGLLSLSSCAASSATGHDTLMSIVQNHSEMAVKCQMKVTPIVSFKHNPYVELDHTITHYAVDFTAVGDELTSSTAPIDKQFVSQGDNPSNHGLHTTIVG